MFDEPKDLFEEGGVPSNLPIGGQTPPKSSEPAPASTPYPEVVTMPPLQREEISVMPTPKIQGDANGSKKIPKIIFVVLIVLVILTVAGYLSYQLLTRKPDEALTIVPPTDETISVTPTEDEEIKPEPKVEDEPEVIAVVDSDGDGLSDADEMELGTDSDLVDTDDDGLGDREEVKVYGTDPLNADTDDDTYKDGAEVEKGYNPKGSGKLFEVPTP